MTEYRFETFAPTVVDGAPDSQTADYLSAVQLGFHEERPKPKRLLRLAERSIADGRHLTAAYPSKAPVGGLDPSVPVATFAHFEKQVNVGGGRLVPAHLITWVTVRPTHRRRGLLRTMMTANLQQAADAGYPFAALTATEGGIYRRFGFGTATWYSSYDVDTSPGFALVNEPDRRVEMCDPKELSVLAPELYAQFQKQSPGAAGRQQTYFQVYDDLATGDLELETEQPNLSVRAALHYDEDGRPDGYVSYKFSGWDVQPATLEVIDLIAISDAAYSSLWAFLGAIDLVTRVKFTYGAAQSPLPWLLSDPRRAQATGTKDGIWLRILDTAASLRARPWQVPGTLTLSIEDSMGYAEGVYRLTSGGEDATVEQIADAADASLADLSMGVAELGSIYLGGADPAVLTRAGRISEHTAGAAERARAMFGLERAPFAPSEF